MIRIADVAMMQTNDTITLAEAYEAVGIFLESVWHRLDKPQEEIAFLLAGLRWVDGTPVDPAIWQDWLAAVQSVKEETVKRP